MKKVLISIIAATVLPMSMAFAETTTTTTTSSSNDENFFERIIGPYYQDLELTNQQKTTISNIHEKHKQAEFREVEAVLTPAQKEKWDKLKPSRQESLVRKTDSE